ncbi:Fic/DOC family N-terminal domain-containing protein [Sphingobium sp. SJ10-10]|nr:Fic/DOC family N-terminal domain-containing protein [Sphingobium sp. SJ10-10]
MNRNNLAHAVRERLVRYPEPHASHYGVLPLPPPESALPLGSAQPAHERALAMLGRAEALAASLPDPYIISRTLSRREAVDSSAIEGTNSTLDELLTIEEEDDDARDAARQVRDYALTLDRLLPRAAAEGIDIFTVQMIQELHHEAMQHDPEYPDSAGALRNIVVWIGGTGHISTSTYNPAPPGQVGACLEDTAAYMRCEGMQAMTQSLITRMAIAHAHFEAVHPFRDGNGRVGRLLLPMMMAAEGQVPLYLAPYIAANRDGYYSGLKIAQQRLEWGPLVGYLSDAITGTVEELFATRDGLNALKEQWRGRRKFRSNSAALRALDLLSDYPVVTMKRLAQKLGVSRPQALSAINQLMEAGILSERTGYSRNRIFAAQEVLAIVNRPFGSNPSERS